MAQTEKFQLLVFATMIAALVDSANILAIFPHTGKSHFFMFQPFVNKLAERGHKVTVITHFPDEKPPPNVEYITITNPNDTIFFNSMNLSEIDEVGKIRALATVIRLRSMGLECCENGLSHPNLQAFLKKPRHFDVAIIEFFNTDCFASLAHIFKVPLIGIFSSVMMPWHNDRFGIPDNPSYINNHFLELSSRMNFWQRTFNTLATYGSKLAYRLTYQPPVDLMVKKYIGDNIPPVAEIVNNSSLFLLNSHFSLFQPRPLVPGVIELGGFHVSPPTGKIPADILKFIEKSPHGVIFFSLGSTVRCSTLSKERLKTFQNVFSKLPQRVLWKWEEDGMVGKPDNVLLGKWFPQNEILSHPNVKLFITHSGLMGTEEAVYHGVPMIMLPLFGDQPVNAAACVEKGIGVIVDYYSLTEERLSEGLSTVLKDKRYNERSKLLAKIFVDRPLSIMDTAIYWTEYVLRYNGAPQLRSAVIDLPWYQELLLDVFAFIFILIGSFFFLVKRMFAVFFYKKIPKEASKQKKS